MTEGWNVEDQRNIIPSANLNLGNQGYAIANLSFLLNVRCPELYERIICEAVSIGGMTHRRIPSHKGGPLGSWRLKTTHHVRGGSLPETRRRYTPPPW